MAQAHDYLVDTTNLAFDKDESQESYTVTFPKPFRKVKRLQLLYAAVPKTVYHTTGATAFFLNRDSAGANAVTMPARAYVSGTELAAVMQTQIRALVTGASATTVTFAVSTGKLTIAESGSTFEITDVEVAFETISGFLGVETGTDSMEASSVIDLTYPRSLAIRMTVQDIPIPGIETINRQYSYHMALATTNYGQVEEFTDNSSWEQLGQQINNFPDFDRLKVEWLLPDGHRMPVGAFNGANHQLMFRVWSMTGRGYR